ncbi:MAG: DNA/RNA nuclease SfsA [Rhodobacterales bacterium]|nr:DNA/RNA nuclease SfsA [Rhodobacterales bacterium]MDX5501424.1 DNA/RNA nuclease SfsA [Rhodobacterales bacterium]
MRFPTPLFASRLQQRYKRFLADMQMPDGSIVTAHCPNPGAMTGLADPGMTCWLAPARPGAKLDWGWKLAELPGAGMAMIDTGLANRVVAEALEARSVPGLPPYETIRPEVRLDSESRIDFRLDGADGPVWVEVKSVTLSRGGWAEFPDTRTDRGARHLRALTAAVQRGERAAMVYLLARDDCDRIRIAADIDPAYAAAFAEARAAGVAMLGLGCRITTDEVVAAGPVAIG